MVSAGAKRPARLQGVTVLVVEDDPDGRELLRQILEANGATVAVAADGVEALEQLTTAVPDLVLADLRMPRVDGFRLIAEIRQDIRWKRLPVVAVTAYSTRADLRATLEAGFDGHIGKPADLDVLIATIQRVLSTRRRLARSGVRSPRPPARRRRA